MSTFDPGSAPDWYKNAPPDWFKHALAENPLLKQCHERMAKIEAQHVDMLCAAYIMATGYSQLHPGDVELVRETNGTVTRWFFRPRS